MAKIIFLALALLWIGNVLSETSKVIPRNNLAGSKRYDIPRPPKESCTCGVKTVTRIVGGEETTVNEYPWMAAICSSSPCGFYSQFCGGSLINDQYILTASHCVQDLTAADIVVSLGDHDLLTSSEADSVEINAEKIIMHPEYNSNTENNDIALVKLQSKVTMSDTIGTICLPPPKKNYVGETAYVSGWGALSSGGSYPSALREVAVPVISQRKCRQSYGLDEITERMLCAGKKDSDRCQGDSGGPLIYEDDMGYYDQIGVVSWGYGCAHANYPGVYARVNTFLGWIARKTKDATYCTNPSPTKLFLK